MDRQECPMPLSFGSGSSACGERGPAYLPVREAVTDVAIKVSAFGICRQEFVIVLQRNVEILIDCAIAELQFEQASIGEIGNRG
jgi:hypothetical protein